MKGATIILAVVLLFGAATLFAQDTPPDPARLSIETARQQLQEISVSKFEDAGFWRVSMPMDAGVITHRRLEGAPAEKEAIEQEEQLEQFGQVLGDVLEEDRYVLGVRADFFRRGPTHISIEPSRPLAIPGIAKTLSMWVVGRNFQHELKVVIQDQFGTRNVLSMGTLNFSGWRLLTVAIPPGIRQRDPHYINRTGISILGFIIEPYLPETYGSYYVYFDDLRAYTDLFSEANRDPDDMVDNW